MAASRYSLRGHAAQSSDTFPPATTSNAGRRVICSRGAAALLYSLRGHAAQ